MRDRTLFFRWDKMLQWNTVESVTELGFNFGAAGIAKYFQHPEILTV